MSQKNRVTQRPYGKKIHRAERLKFLTEKASRERHQNFLEMNEQFRAGNRELLADVERTRLFIEQAVAKGTVEEKVYLLFVENLKAGNPFRPPFSVQTQPN